MNILLLGPQGSGKGTQAKLIASARRLPHIASGEMLRSAMAAQTPFGLLVKPIVDAGELVSDTLMIGLIRERLEAADAHGGFILDGFPRNLAQAEALDAMLGEITRDLDVAFELQIPDELCIARLLRRAREEGRSDDTPEVIGRRLEIYHRETAPLVEYYRATGKLVSLHADLTIDEVAREIDEALGQAVGA